MAQAPLEAKKRLAFMPDEPHLFEYMTVQEHLRLIGRLYAVPDIDARARPLLDELELARQGALAAWRTVARDASEGGHRMRSGARSAGAPVRRAADRARPDRHPADARHHRATGQQGAAVLLSSHLLPLVQEICTRVIIMDRAARWPTAPSRNWRRGADLAEAGSTLEQIFLRVTGHDRALNDTR